MSDITQFISASQQGDAGAAKKLLPQVYEELRRLAAAKLAHEQPGQTLQATALVHEAYLRLVGHNAEQPWESRGHFFAAAAEAMRRILVENARRKGRLKHGGEWNRVDDSSFDVAMSLPDERFLAIDEALARLATEEPILAELVKLRFFAGCSLTEAAEMLNMSRTKAYEQWAYARAWLRCEVEGRG